MRATHRADGPAEAAADCELTWSKNMFQQSNRTQVLEIKTNNRLYENVDVDDTFEVLYHLKKGLR